MGQQGAAAPRPDEGSITVRRVTVGTCSSWLVLLGDAVRPEEVHALSSGVISVSSGCYHTCAVLSSGAAMCWGRSNSGQLGNGDIRPPLTTITPNYYPHRVRPTYVAGLRSGVASIACGCEHTCALTSAGAVMCWGLGSLGQLGNGASQNSLTPVNVNGLSTDVVLIASGNHHTCVVTTLGAVKCWGYGTSGQLGNGLSQTQQAPVNVNGITSGAITIAAGGSHTCAVLSSGSAKCWGSGGSGQMGDYDGAWQDRNTPVTPLGLSSGVANIAVGGDYTCAVLSSGSAKCWGDNQFGQIGDGSVTRRTTPVAVSGLSNVVAITASGKLADSISFTKTCALSASGVTMCWGTGYLDGRIGDNVFIHTYDFVDLVPSNITF